MGGTTGERAARQKSNAAPEPQGGAAFTERQRRFNPGRVIYVRGASSTIHGQKFCGFRVVVAFLMTLIFMILLRFCRMAD